MKRTTSNGKRALRRVAAVSLFTLGVVGPVQATTVQVQPVADAFVNDTYPNMNFGALTSLYVGDQNYNTPIQTCRTYLRFDLTALPANVTVSSARIYLFAKAEGPNPPVNAGAHYLSNNSWSELGITWSNAPTNFNPTPTDLHPAAFHWDSWDVTPDVAANLPGNPIMSFVMKEPEEGTDHNWVCWSSKEDDPGFQPYLEIEYDESGPPPEEVNILPDDDAYVNDTYPTTNYGSSTTLYIGDQNYNTPIQVCRTYIKFVLDAVPPGAVIDSAKIHIFSWGVGPDPDITAGAHYMTSDAWSETSITWNNAPTGFSATGTDVHQLQHHWNVWDVTADVSDAFRGDGTYSAVLKEITEGTDHNWIGFDSKEYIEWPEYRPYLQVKYRSGPGGHRFLVRPDGSGDFATIQAAINFAADGDTIDLADGTFTGTGNRDLDFLGKDIIVWSLSGDPTACTIDCQGSETNPHRGFLFHRGEPATALLAGVRITGAYVSSVDDTTYLKYGGGIHIGAGAGPYSEPSPTIRNCIITLNSARTGGGIYCGYGCNSLIEDCLICMNDATDGAAGLAMGGDAAPLVRGCTFCENLETAILGFGQDNGTFVDCDIWGTQDSYCSVRKRNGGSITLENCTIAQNEGLLVVLVEHNVPATIDNTIIAFNEGDAVYTSWSSVSLSCCDIFGNDGGDWTGGIAGQLGQNGNISLDPLFCDEAAQDFTLQGISPCRPFSGPNYACDLIGAFGVGCGPYPDDYADHDVGNCQLTVTDQGIIGFMDATQTLGSGFVYPAAGSNLLYIGSLWVGESDNYVANRDYSADPSQEWTVSAVPDGHVYEEGADDSDQDIHTWYDDGGDLLVHQESWAYAAPAAADDFVIMGYTLMNDSDDPLTGIYAGVFLDFDITEMVNNIAETDPARDMAYIAHPSGLHGGVRLLTKPGDPPLSNATVIHNPTWVYPQSHVLDADKYGFLSAGAPQYVVPSGGMSDDFSVLVSAGPLDLAPGEEVHVAFAILGAASLDELEQNADAAQMAYCAGIAATPEVGTWQRPETQLLPCAPNPFDERTLIRFQLAQPAEVDLGIYDVNGRRLRTLVKGWCADQGNSLTWDSRDDAGRVVSSGVYFLRMNTGTHSQSRRLIRLR